MAINVLLRVQERGEDGPMLALLSCGQGEHIRGKVIDQNKRLDSWLLFRIPRKLCPEGGLLTLSAVVDDSVLWQKAYRVVWFGRFPRLEPVC